MSVPFKSSPIEFNQHLLFPSNIFDLLAEDHECYLYTELFQQLDTSAVKTAIRLKARTLITPADCFYPDYAYSRGVFSSGKSRDAAVKTCLSCSLRK